MKIKVLTLFPEMFDCLKYSILGRAEESKLLDIECINIRDYSKNKHKKCDDYPFGGGAGMVMSAQPIYDAIADIDPLHEYHRIYMSPIGGVFTTGKAVELSKKDKILLLCGHYEGVDQRAIDMTIDEEISIGDYILTGGELPAMVVIDALSRHIDNVLAKESLTDESFNNNLLEYPQYTRPQVFLGESVPDVLMSGHHAMVDKWRLEKSLERTERLRPDLYKKHINSCAKKDK